MVTKIAIIMITKIIVSVACNCRGSFQVGEIESWVGSKKERSSGALVSRETGVTSGATSGVSESLETRGSSFLASCSCRPLASPLASLLIGVEIGGCSWPGTSPALTGFVH